MECEFRKYQMFDGKMKVFRSEGGQVKSDEEKRQMAEKHRFKKHRDFKQRLEEQEENEDADIRSFTFHRHDVFEERKDRRPREPRESRGSRGPKDARFSKPGKSRFERNDKRNFGKKRNRFDNDDED